MIAEVTLGAGEITAADLVPIGQGAPVALAPDGLARMRAGEAVMRDAVAEDRPIYGVTTGLGPRAVDRLGEAARGDFPAATVLGRAHALGPALPVAAVRAAMAIRVHTLLSGAVGVRPALAEHIAACLNEGLIPVIGESASIGAADLLWGGSLGAGLIGSGEMDTPWGRLPAADAFDRAGIAPWQPFGREGLALASHSSVTAALAALGFAGLQTLLEAGQTAAALMLEGFRGNLSPLDPDLLALSPKPGQGRAAAGLMRRLDGSELHQKRAARRLQDPLSLRNIVQVQGAGFAALEFLEAAVMGEINGLSDNPVVLVERGEVLSGGSYLSPQVAIALGAVNQAAVHLAAQQVARMGKMLANRFSDLPQGLTDAGIGGAGFGAMMKAPEALAAEIAHLAQPAPVYPSPSADALEDTVTHAAIPAKALHEIVQRLSLITAMELMVSTQAVELRGVAIAPALDPAMAMVREISPRLEVDRSLSAEIETLAARLRAGAFSLQA
ncbi:MAG: aromatic amino acid lyase [Pseudomonadota bacterium]